MNALSPLAGLTDKIRTVLCRAAGQRVLAVRKSTPRYVCGVTFA